MLRTLARRALLCGTSIAAAAALAGCAQTNYRLDHESATQQDVIGSVHVESRLCRITSGDLNHDDGMGSWPMPPEDFEPVQDAAQRARDVGFPEGAARGTSDDCTPGNDQAVQVLFAFLVPAGVDAPAATPALTADDGSTLAVSLLPSYAAQLDGAYGAAMTPQGKHWIAYVSEPTTSATGPWTLDGTIPLPQGSDGSPFPAPFGIQTTGGAYVIGSGEPLTSDSDMAGVCDQVDQFCQDAISPLHQVATRDLSILEPAAAGAVQGETATLRFPLRFAGVPADDVRFALAATSDLPGAKVTPADAEYAPAAADRIPGGGPDLGKDEVVDVAVPAGAAPGDYAVTLTATVGGQVRRAVGRITVSPNVGQLQGTQAPSVSRPVGRQLRLVRFTLGGGLVSGSTLDAGRATCTKPAGTVCWGVTADVLVTRAELAGAGASAASPLVRVGHTRMRIAGGRSARIRVRLSPSVRRLLARGRTVTARVVVRDYAGLDAAAVRRVRLHRSSR